MASKYDQPSNEPDLDKYSDKPIDAADDPQDEEPWLKDGEDWPGPPYQRVKSQAFELAMPIGNDAIDQAEHAAQSLLVAIADVQRHLQQVRTLEEGQRVQKWVRLAWKALDRLALDASEIIDQAIERRR